MLGHRSSQNYENISNFEIESQNSESNTQSSALFEGGIAKSIVLGGVDGITTSFAIICAGSGFNCNE